MNFGDMTVEGLLQVNTLFKKLAPAGNCASTSHMLCEA